ncbi:MAG: hypothetical protein H7Y43_04540 [Akkermansiaceae bacterium]|nr:hypothetical protein [Verrucomicrobiales bacterium]
MSPASPWYNNFVRLAALFIALIVGAGCRSYVDSTPAQLREGDHLANYRRIFREPIPSHVTVVNSAVVTYSFRPGVVATDDFEFELLASPAWIQKKIRRYFLDKGEDDFIRDQLNRRRTQARRWYAPGPLDQYDLYRDGTSLGYVHMLVKREMESDGRRRVFISKH